MDWEDFCFLAPLNKGAALRALWEMSEHNPPRTEQTKPATEQKKNDNGGRGE